MNLEQEIARGEQAVREMSDAIKDLQKLRDQKEVETMQLRRKKEKEPTNG